MHFFLIFPLCTVISILLLQTHSFVKLDKTGPNNRGKCTILQTNIDEASPSHKTRDSYGIGVMTRLTG